jgi:hypothetical protein
VEDDLDAAFAALADAGMVSPARSPKADWKWAPSGAGLPAGTAGRLLDELRSERGGEEE